MPFVDALHLGGRKIEFEHLVSGQKVAFPAFLTQFEDQFTSEWNEETVYGRMDQIATFKRTGRKINLGWDVPSRSAREAEEMLGRISLLVRMLYPSYVAPRSSGGPYAASATHIAGPPLLRVKFVNLIQNVVDPENGLLGYVNGFTTSPVLESGFIESTNSEGNSGLSLYPKAYKLSCTFIVLHTFTPGWVAGGQWSQSEEDQATTYDDQSTHYFGSETAHGDSQVFPYGTRHFGFGDRSTMVGRNPTGLDVGQEVDDLHDAADSLEIISGGRAPMASHTE